MLEREKVFMRDTNLRTYFDEDFSFGGEQGLNVAVTFINFRDRARQLDWTYGSFLFLEHEWSIDPVSGN